MRGRRSAGRTAANAPSRVTASLRGAPAPRSVTSRRALSARATPQTTVRAGASRQSSGRSPGRPRRRARNVRASATQVRSDVAQPEAGGRVEAGTGAAGRAARRAGRTNARALARAHRVAVDRPRLRRPPGPGSCRASAPKLWRSVRPSANRSVTPDGAVLGIAAQHGDERPAGADAPARRSPRRGGAASRCAGRRPRRRRRSSARPDAVGGDHAGARQRPALSAGVRELAGQAPEDAVEAGQAEHAVLHLADRRAREAGLRARDPHRPRQPVAGIAWRAAC